MLTLVGILTFMCRIDYWLFDDSSMDKMNMISTTSKFESSLGFMLSRVEHEKSFITSVLDRPKRLATAKKFWIYSQTCVKHPYKTRHIFGFSDRWLLLIAV